MKKLFSLLLIILAIWVGTTFFIGQKMKQNLQAQINKSNNLLNNTGVKYKLKTYKKNFLFSTATIKIEVTDPTILELLNNSFKLPIMVDYQIEHGPIFFKNGLNFGVAKIEKKLLLSSLLKESAKKEFLTLLKNDIKITTHINFSFTKNADYKLITNEININKDGKNLHLTPIKITGTNNIETFQGVSQIELASFKFVEDSNRIKLQNLLLNIKIKEFIEKNLILGNIDLAIDKLFIKDNNPVPIDIALNLHMNNKKDSQTTMQSNFQGEIDFTDTKLPSNLPQLKNIQTKINLNYLGINGLVEFKKAAQKMQEAEKNLFSTIGKISNSEFEIKLAEFKKFQQKMVKKVIKALNNLLIKNKSTISYQLKGSTKDKKESNLTVEIGYTGDINFKGDMQDIIIKVQQDILNLLNFKINLNLSKDHLKSFPNTLLMKQQIQMAVAQGFVTEINNSYILNGYYKNQELLINDNNLTSLILPFLMMSQAK